MGAVSGRSLETINSAVGFISVLNLPPPSKCLIDLFPVATKTAYGDSVATL